MRGVFLAANKFLKLILSFAISFIILNIVCFFYYNVPVHSESKTNSTDYVWEESKFYSRGTEGFAWGKTDSNGFNNVSAKHSSKPEILIMGTSHTEAFNVQQNENYAYLFNELAEQNGMNLNAYNIGISGHRITTCLNNFECALNEFEPSKYVVMEVTTTDLTMEEIKQVSEGTVKKNHSSANPVLVFLQKIPFIRCVYYQLDNLGVDIKAKDKQADKTIRTVNSTPQNVADENKLYEDALNSLFGEIGKVADDNGVKLIIVYHSELFVDEGGSVISQQPDEKREIFNSVCSRNGIVFVDMHEAFAESYNETYKLPYGFSNTAVGKGHLNKYGHEIISNELYKLIAELEKQA